MRLSQRGPVHKYLPLLLGTTVAFERHRIAMVPDPVEVIDLTELTDSSDDEENLDANQDETQSSSEDEGSSSEGSEVAVDATSRAALHQVIASISESRLRQVIANLVDSVPAVERAMTRELVSFDQRSRAVTPRWETCGNCGEKYDLEVSRESNECKFHPGIATSFPLSYPKLTIHALQARSRSTKQALSTGMRIAMALWTPLRTGVLTLRILSGLAAKKIPKVRDALFKNTCPRYHGKSSVSSDHTNTYDVSTLFRSSI